MSTLTASTDPPIRKSILDAPEKKPFNTTPASLVDHSPPNPGRNNTIYPFRENVAMFVDFDNLLKTAETFPGEKLDIGRLMRLWQPFGFRLVVANLYSSRLMPYVQIPEGVTDEETIRDAIDHVMPTLPRRNFILIEMIREGFRPIILPHRVNSRGEGDDVDALMTEDICLSIELIPTIRTIIIASHDHGFQYVTRRVKRMHPEIEVIAFVLDDTLASQLARSGDGCVNVRSPIVRLINPLLASSAGTSAQIAEKLISSDCYREILCIIQEMVPILRKVYRNSDYVASPSFLRNMVYGDHDFPSSKRISEIEVMNIVKLLIRLSIIYQAEGLPPTSDGEETEDSGTTPPGKTHYTTNFQHPLLEKLLTAASRM